MSNARIAAIGYLVGAGITILLNAMESSPPILNCVRFIMGGLVLAAAAVALFGDRKR